MEKIKYLGIIVLLVALFYGLFLFSFRLDTKFLWKAPIYLNITYKRAQGEAIKRIVFWTSWFGDPQWRHIMKGKKEIVVNCPDVQCTAHTDRSNPLLYDALLFHGRDPQSPPKQRNPNQVYIMFLQESPVHRGGFINGGKFYNWTATYDTRSDIWTPYWHFKRKQKHDPTLAKLPQMTYNRSSSEAMVAWVVSNCNTHSKREVYVSALKQHIKVDIYGGCGKRCYKNHRLHGHACHEALAKTGRYKFYLSFENSACRDYITEKTYHPLKAGMVPIVYGGKSGKDYIKKLPPNSFIDVRNFQSPKHLAKYLFYLDKNDTAYMAYHAWKMDYEFADIPFLCPVCKALYNNSMTKPRNVNWGQFWNPYSQCDAHLINKVKG